MVKDAGAQFVRRAETLPIRRLARVDQDTGGTIGGRDSGGGTFIGGLLRRERANLLSHLVERPERVWLRSDGRGRSF
jgi:hypothetical protein